jgi:hypothetical protein
MELTPYWIEMWDATRKSHRVVQEGFGIIFAIHENRLDSYFFLFVLRKENECCRCRKKGN